MGRISDGLAVVGEAGVGDGPDALADAVRVAVDQAAEGLGGQRPDLVTVFACGADPDALAEVGPQVWEALRPGALVGAVTPGVLGRGRGVEGPASAPGGRGETAVSVWAAVLPGARVRPFHLEVVPVEGSLAVVGTPTPEDDDAAALLLADPWSFPAEGFLERADPRLAGLSLVGGLAAGPRGAGSSRLFVDGRVHHRGAVGVLLGAVVARTLVAHGCRPVGPPMTVTSAEGDVVLELAGTSALRKVQQVLDRLDPDDQALASRGLQLGVVVDEYVEEHTRGDFLVRSVLGAQEERGGLVVGRPLDVGTTVQLQVRDAASAAEDLQARLAEFRRSSGLAVVDGALLVTCTGRGSHLFGVSAGGASSDVVAVRQGLPTSTVAGFSAAGEIGPVAGRAHLHGFTAALLALGA